MYCSCAGCIHPAMWTPAFVLAYSYVDRIGGQARVELKLAFCDGHRRQMVINDLLTDGAWQRIKDTLEVEGRILPPRESIELDFKHAEWGYCN